MINFDLNKQFDENCAYEFVGFLARVSGASAYITTSIFHGVYTITSVDVNRLFRNFAYMIKSQQGPTLLFLELVSPWQP